MALSPAESRPPAVWRRVYVSLDCLHDATGGRAPGAESGGSRAILPEQEEQVRSEASRRTWRQAESAVPILLARRTRRREVRAIEEPSSFGGGRCCLRILRSHRAGRHPEGLGVVALEQGPAE